MEVEATRAAPAFKQAELPLALLVSSVGTAAARERHLKSLTARQCKRARDPAARLTQ